MNSVLKRTVCAVLSAVTAVSVMTASALPYNSYVYDAYDEAVYAPDVYVPSKVINGNALGTGDFNEPTSITCDSDGNMYIVDSLNNRIIMLDSNQNLSRIYSAFDFNGTTEVLSKPNSVYITDGGIMYISDYGNKRIIISDMQANVKSVITKPSSSIYPQDKDFAPMDLVVTSTGVLYVIIDGIYQGVVVFDANNTFDGFFGANQVEPTFEVVAGYFWKQFATKEQKSKMARYVPVQYVSLAIDKEDFVFATVASSKQPKNRLKKLNPQGKNILNGADGEELFFGDPQTYTYMGETSSTLLTSVDVINGSVITTLDRMSKKVFQYSQDGRLVTVFGGDGNSVGTFSDPVSVCSFGNYVAVLDKQKANITFFVITEYGTVLQKALAIYTDGLYTESADYWKTVLKYNSNSAVANLGYGKALMQQGEYENAMQYFKKANDKAQYSAAYKEYRKIKIRKNFTLYVVLLALIAGAAVFAVKFSSRSRKRRRNK